MRRRSFLKAGMAAAAAVGLSPKTNASQADATARSSLPALQERALRWRKFGFLDTHREDLKYENFPCRRLARKMIELLQEI